MCVTECTPGFDDEFLFKLFNKWSSQLNGSTYKFTSLLIRPSLHGLPQARTRKYMLGFKCSRTARRDWHAAIYQHGGPQKSFETLFKRSTVLNADEFFERPRPSFVIGWELKL